MSGLERTFEPRRIEVVTGAGGRRVWSADARAAILDETLVPGAVVSAVARRHGLTPSLLFRWRRQVWDEARAACVPIQPAFVPLALPAPPASVACDPVLQDAALEIELAGGHRLRVQAGVDPALLHTVIAALLGR